MHAKWLEGKRAVSYHSCRRDVAAMWSAMTEAERLRAENSMVSDDEDEAVDRVADTCRAEDMLAIGDGDFPLRTDKFMEFVESHRDATRGDRRPRSDGELGGGGLAFSCGARAAEECARGQKGKFFVSDVQDIPAARKILRPRSCTQIHPGLCCQKDLAIYETALKMAAALERHFTSDLRGSLVEITDPQGLFRGLCFQMLQAENKFKATKAQCKR